MHIPTSVLGALARPTAAGARSPCEVDGSSAAQRFDRVDVAVLIEDRDGALVYANPALARALGTTREDLVAAGSIVGHVDPADRERWLRGCTAPGADAGAPAIDEVRLRDRHGRARAFLAVATTLRWRGGHAIRRILLEVAGDPPATPPAHEAGQRVAQALDDIDDGFALFDSAGRLVFCNEPFRRGIGAGETARPGSSFEALLRAQVASSDLVDAAGREDEWVAERLAALRDGEGVFDAQHRDGRCHQARHYRCADGTTVVQWTDVSTVKQREARLRLSEQRLKDYAGASSDWYWEMNEELRFTYISKRFSDLTGIDTERFLGRYRAEVAPRGAQEGAWRAHLDLLEQRRPFRDFTYWMNDAEGQRRYFRINGVPIYDGDGRFAGYRGTGLDITGEVHAREVQARYLEAIESFSDGYALFDADDRLVAWNSAYGTMLTPSARGLLRRGVSFETLLRADLAGGAFPEAEHDPERFAAERLELHRTCDAPFEMQRSGGRWVLVRERRTPEGGVLLTAGDVTELKLRERALLESEERFRGFAETAADWFWELDEGLCFTFVSERYEQLTGLDAASIVGQTFEAIVEPSARDGDSAREALAALAAHAVIEEIEIDGRMGRDGAIVHSISGRPIVDGGGRFRGYRGSGRDVTQARRLSLQLAYQASHDELTGLVNRRELERRLERAIEHARDGNAHHALCYVDLDQFKVVNDTCGHSAGDELLRQLGHTLKERVRTRDTLARLGGDEFALLLEHCSVEQAERIAETLRETIEAYEFSWDGKRFRLGASIGLAPIGRELTSMSEALRAADSACYLAKDRGRNRVHVYVPGDSDLARREGEMHWVARLNKALSEGRFELHAQPIVPTAVAATADSRPHYELLLRMIDEDGSQVPTGAFLPAAERYGLANRIDRFVVRKALGMLASHRALLQSSAMFAINLSGQSMSDGDFFAFLAAQLREHGLPAGKLCFEVTETAAIADIAGAQRFMHMVRDQGCRFALDDFGTGLCSFAYLRDLPVDFLKIDGSFIRGIEHDAVSRSMVRSINEIGHVLGKKTIAEYVRSERAARLLEDIGVDYVQGFGIGRPLPLAQIVSALR